MRKRSGVAKVADGLVKPAVPALAGPHEHAPLAASEVALNTLVKARAQAFAVGLFVVETLNDLAEHGAVSLVKEAGGCVLIAIDAKVNLGVIIALALEDQGH